MGVGLSALAGCARERVVSGPMAEVEKPRANRHLRDVAATSIGIFAIAATSAVEVLVFLHRYGTTGTTDGVFAAFALYAVVTVFAQNLRTSAVPLVTGEGAVMRPADFTSAIVARGAVVGAGW